MNENQAIALYNVHYAALHEVVYLCNPEEQCNIMAIRDYIRSLPSHTGEKLIRKLSYQPPRIETLRDAMVEAEKIFSQSKEIASLRNARQQNTSGSVTPHLMDVSAIDKSGSEEIFQLSTGRSDFGPRNSTMRADSHNFKKFPQTQGKGFNNSNQNQNNNSNWKQHGNSYNVSPRKSFSKYRHPRGASRNFIKFPYNTAEKESIWLVLRRMIDYLKSMPTQQWEQIKSHKLMPKTTEVSEENVASISINEIQYTMNEDIDVIFNALVAADYIEEEEEA